MKKLKFHKIINPCILEKQELIYLAKLLYSVWENDIKEAEKEWETKKLPELLKKIKEHNKKVRKKETSYLFPSNLSIDDPSQIIEKEKKFFIYTTKGFYEFRSNFAVKFTDKTITVNSPDSLTEGLENGEIEHIEFAITSTDDTRKIKVVIGNEYGDNYYEIEGEEETWVRGIKDKIEEIMNSKSVSMPFLCKSLFKILTSILISSLLLYTLYSFLKKLAWLSFISSQAISLWITIFISVILFFFTLIQSYRFINSQFPYVKLISTKKEPVKISVVLTVLLGLITNLIYDLILYFFK